MLSLYSQGGHTFTTGSWSRFLPLLKPKRPWRIVVGLTAPAAKEASALACKETPFNTMCLYSYGACQLATL